MILLDSHVIIWWLAGHALMSRRALAEIRSATRLLVSPISCWEIAMLADRGRVQLAREPFEWIHALLSSDEVEVAPLTPAAAVTAALLPRAGFPGDPADRLLYSTAVELGVPFVSRDRGLREYARTAGDVRVIW